MSVSVQDWIRAPYDESLTMAGVTFACRSLQQTIYRKDWRSPRRLRSIVAKIASELALRRWLEKEEVFHGLRYEEPFTQRDHPTLLLGGHRVEVCCTLLSARHRIRQLHRNPAWMLTAEAFVPVETLAAKKFEDGDLLLFALFIGLITRTQADIHRVLSTDQPTYLIAIPPHKSWYRPSSSGSLGRVTISCDDPQPINLELIGQLEPQRSHTERLTLNSSSIASAFERTSLQYLHTDRLPLATMYIQSPELKLDWVVKPHAWNNIWIYGMELILTGWHTKGSFLRQSLLLPAGTRTRFSRRIQSENRYLLIKQLRPMRKLVERIRQG